MNASLTSKLMMAKLRDKYPAIHLREGVDEGPETVIVIEPELINRVGVKMFDINGAKELYEAGVSRAFIGFIKGHGWEVFVNCKAGCTIQPIR